MVWFKSLVFVLCLVPAGYLVFLTSVGKLGPNPVETLQHETGEWALILLWVTLAMTPIRRFAPQGWKWVWPIRIRRMLGLFSYFYMCLHFAAYLVFDLELDFAALGADVVKRTWITVGFACWLLLLPLAVTSTQGWQKRLGRRWKKLHRLIYPAAILASLHFLWQEKVLAAEPMLFFVILLLLFMLRIPTRWLPQRLSDQR